MNRDAKVGFALAILLMGIAAALCFPREQPEDMPQLEDAGSIDRRIARQPFAPYLSGEQDVPTVALGPATEQPVPPPWSSDTAEPDPFATTEPPRDALFPFVEESSATSAGRPTTRPAASSHTRPQADGGTRTGASRPNGTSANTESPAASETLRGRVQILPPPPRRNGHSPHGAAPSPPYAAADPARLSKTDTTSTTQPTPQPYLRRKAAEDRAATTSNPRAAESFEHLAATTGVEQYTRADDGETLDLWPPFDTGRRADPRAAVEPLPAPRTYPSPTSETARDEMVDAGIPPRAAHGESAARRTSAGAGPPPSAGTAALPPARNAQWRILRDDTTTPRAAPRNPFETHARPNAEHSGSVDRPDAGKGRVERLDPPPGPAPIAAGHHTAAKPAVPLTPAAASERSPQTDSTNARRGDGASPGGYRIHVVRRGETLSEIALRYLGSVARYREIFDANRDVLRDPDSIREGMTLRIPTARSAAPRNRPIPAHRIRAARDAQ